MSFSDLFASTPLRNMFYDPSDDKEAAEAGLQEGRDAYANLPEVQFGNMNMQGPMEAKDVSFSPVAAQMGEVTMAGPTAYNDIAVNPEYKAAQANQLAALDEMRKSGGMTAQDQANLAGIQNAELANERGQREAILQKARMQGTASGGNALMAQLMGQQAAASDQNMQGLNVAGMAQNRALQAAQAGGQLGGQMENKAYGEEAQKAAASDAINRFNAQNSTGMSQANAQAANQMGQFNAGNTLGAQQFNVNKAQGVNNATSAAKNQNQYYNQYAMPQQQFSNAATKASGQAGVGANAANVANQQMASNQQSQAGIWGGLTQLGGKVVDKFVPGAGHGGRIPGLPAVHGDSQANDSFHLMASPGEVVVPRSLAMSNNPKAIATFVQHAPSVHTPDQKKAAMLSALKNMRRR